MTATEYARRSCEIIDRWNASEIDADEYLAQLEHLKAQRDGEQPMT